MARRATSDGHAGKAGTSSRRRRKRRLGTNSALGAHRVAKLGELLAAQLVALAAGDTLEQVAHERRELDRVERLRHVVDPAGVEPARAIAKLGTRREEDDRDVCGAVVVEQLL